MLETNLGNMAKESQVWETINKNNSQVLSEDHSSKNQWDDTFEELGQKKSEYTELLF